VPDGGSDALTHVVRCYVTLQWCVSGCVLGLCLAQRDESEYNKQNLAFTIYVAKLTHVLWGLMLHIAVLCPTDWRAACRFSHLVYYVTTVIFKTNTILSHTLSQTHATKENDLTGSRGTNGKQVWYCKAPPSHSLWTTNYVTWQTQIRREFAIFSMLKGQSHYLLEASAKLLKEIHSQGME
jgi:hypothetical protein